MAIFLIVVKNIVVVFLTVIQLAMLVRAILSWFPMDGNRFTDFLFAITEPFIYPVRMLFDKLNWFTGLPIDVSFLATYFIISVLLFILP